MNVIEQYVNTHIEHLIPHAQYRPYPKLQNRDFWEGLNSMVRNHYIKEGEQYLSFEWKSITATSFLEVFRSGDKSANENQIFSKRNALGSLILAECIEHQGRFLEQIANGIWSTCEETVWSVGAHLKYRGNHDGLPDTKEGHPLDLYSLSTANLIAFAEYMLGEELDTLSKAITHRMRRELYKRTVEPYLTRNDDRWMGGKSGSLNYQTPWCTYNALSVILLSCQDEKSRKFALLKGARSLDRYYQSLSHDGSCDEGPEYWTLAGLRLIESIDLIQNAVKGGKELFRDEKIRNIALFYRRTHIDKEWFLNFADTPAKVKSTIPYNLYYLAKLMELPELEGEATVQFRANPNPETLRPDYEIARHMIVLSYFDQLLQSTAKAQPVTKVWYPDIQVMVSRELPQYGKGLLLAAKGGHNGERRNHNDIGSFIVFKNGNPVFIDVGNTQDQSSDRTKRSPYHNLPYLQEGEQKTGKEFCATKVSYSTTSVQDRFSMDLSGAYGLQEGFICRQFVFDRENQWITVTDRLSQNRPNQWVLMTAERPEMKENGFMVADCSITLSEGCVAVEPIPLKDPKLTGVWGNMCYRVLITADTDQLILTIK